MATRSDTEFCHGYAFTSRPLLLGEHLVIQILATEAIYLGTLALGFTSCDPAKLSADDLPDDSDLLLDRPEYWVVSKDIAFNPQPGDEISFTVTHYGEVNYKFTYKIKNKQQNYSRNKTVKKINYKFYSQKQMKKIIQEEKL